MKFMIDFYVYVLTQMWQKLKSLIFFYLNYSQEFCNTYLCTYLLLFYSLHCPKQFQELWLQMWTHEILLEFATIFIISGKAFWATLNFQVQMYLLWTFSWQLHKKNVKR